MHGEEGQDILALLVLDAISDARDAAIGLRARRLLVDHLELGVERVTGTHRLHPAQLIEAGRAHAGGAEDAALEHHAEAQNQSVEAAGDKAPIIALARRLDIDVEGLRIVSQPEIDDHALGERDAARREFLADGEVVEIALGHGALPQPSAAAIAPPSSLVPALPPRSAVFGALLSAST